jgi:hypothetical protein
LATLANITADPNADPEQKKQVNEILIQLTKGVPVAQLYKQIDPNLKSPTIANLGPRFDKVIEARIPAYTDYVRNADEYESQNKMLLDILLMLSGGG